VPWAKFDDRFPSNRKIRLLSDGAFRLYVSAVCWSAENLTDGVIGTSELRLVADVRAARTRAKELVDHGLWEIVPGVGWCIHDYHEYQPTADQVRQQRKTKAARQKRWRDGRDGSDDDPDGDRVDASTDASRDASRDGAGDAAPTRPDPYPSSVSTGGCVSDPLEKAAAPSELRSEGLPFEGKADHSRAEDPLPVVGTVTIPASRRDLGARPRTAEEINRDMQDHVQGCGPCQAGFRKCAPRVRLVEELLLAAPEQWYYDNARAGAAGAEERPLRAAEAPF